MKTLYPTQNASDFIDDVNANLQEMGSETEVSTSMSAGSLVSSLSTEFDDVADAVELDADQSAATFVQNLNTNFGLAGQGNTQYSAEIADTISKVNQLSSNKSLVLFAVTDIHYDCRITEPAPDATKKVFDDSVINMAAVADDTDVDAVLCMGDMIDGSSDTTKSVDDADNVISDLQSVELPFYIALGNHDNNRNGYGSGFPVFDRATMKSMFLDYMSDDVAFANQSYKSDFYKDFSSYGIRMICIYGNSGTNGAYSFGSETRDFLSSSLANLPSGYKAIVVTHVPPIQKWNYNNTSRPNGDDVKNIVLQYGDKVIAMLYGHCHEDNVWADPFCGIGICCNKSVATNGRPSLWCEDGTMPYRSTDAANADLWDAVVVNTTAKLIDMVRFGAGADRTVHYEPIECAAGASVTLTSKISGGTWGLRTSDQSKASVANGVVTVDANTTPGTLLQVWCKSADWTVNSNKVLTAGSAVEYWTIKVVTSND